MSRRSGGWPARCSIARPASSIACAHEAEGSCSAPSSCIDASSAADGPSAAVEVRTASAIGQRPSTVGPGTRAEGMLWEWAASIPDPSRRTAKMRKEPLEPLIASFARVDSPNDPILPRSYIADAAIVEPATPIDDGQLHVCAVRFRDAMLRSERLFGATAPAMPDDPWRTFVELASFVTPGDLRYTHSLQTVTSLRPTSSPGRRGARRGTRVEPGDDRR